jgi:hypothetical protein
VLHPRKSAAEKSQRTSDKIEREILRNPLTAGGIASIPADTRRHQPALREGDREGCGAGALLLRSRAGRCSA